MVIYTTDGKQMKALKVISEAVKYIKDTVLTSINDRYGNAIEKLLVSQVKWVIMVPAIWSEKAKQFMRKASIQVSTKMETNIDKKNAIPTKLDN